MYSILKAKILSEFLGLGCYVVKDLSIVADIHLVNHGLYQPPAHLLDAHIHGEDVTLKKVSSSVLLKPCDHHSFHRLRIALQPGEHTFFATSASSSDDRIG